MKYDFIIHARYKRIKDSKNDHTIAERVLTCSPLTERERELYTIDAKGGITLAVVKNSDDTTITWSLAKCNIKDSYNKKIGRNIAIGRAKKYGITTKDMPFEDVVNISKKLVGEIDSKGWCSIYTYIGEEILSLK